MARFIIPLSSPLVIFAGFAGTLPVYAQEHLRSVPAEKTAAAVTERNWKAPRTSWGHPSLEGVWTSDDMRSIPRNRPDEFGDRDSLTQEEFAERAGRDAEQRRRRGE